MQKESASQLEALCAVGGLVFEQFCQCVWETGLRHSPGTFMVCKTDGSQQRASRRFTMASLLLVAVVRVHTATCGRKLHHGFCRWSRHTLLGMRELRTHADR